MNKGLKTEKVADRVREHSAAADNKTIDREAEGRVQRFAGKSKEEITEQIDRLEREWDMERLLETNASILSLAGMSAYAGSRNKKWLFLPGVVMSFLVQHSVQGWCPPMPVFRKLGVRTRQEIEREKYALKALRGDFDGIAGEDFAGSEHDAEKVDEMIEAVKA
jgi:hypothetical protein